MPKSSPGVRLIALDVEFTVLVFVKAIRPRDDHRADGMGALDVRVVVDLDPLRDLSARSNASANPLSRRACVAVSDILRARLSRALRSGVLHQLGLFAALGDHDLDLASGLFGQRICHQIIIVEAMRQDQHPRRFAVGIELADKGLHHLGRVLVPADARVIVVVAPVLVGADEEHLHAGLPAISVQRDHVRLGHALRVDALGGLHLGQRLDPVAQGGGALELHRFAGLLHLRRQRFLNTLGAALQELSASLHGRGVILFGHQTDSRGPNSV